MNLFESFAPHNIDSLFVNQNSKAKENILTVYRMPEILLGLSSQGMFNEASYNDAFDYKNADTERDRRIVERVFQKVVDNSVFPIPQVEIEPLEMKKSQEDEVVDTIEISDDKGIEDNEGVINSEVDQQTKDAQAALKGSVGGVQGVLDIQKSFSEGLTSLESAISILTIIFGFTVSEARRLLGEPEKETV